MKKILLATIALFVSTTGFGQNHIFDNPSNKAYWGVRAALDVNIPGKLKYTYGGTSVETKILGTAPGVSLGVVYNIPLVANLYLEPGLFVGYDTESIEIDAAETDMGKEMLSNRSLRKFAGSLPVQLGYHFDLMGNVSFAVFTGPVLKVGFSNDYYLTTKSVYGRSLHYSGSMYGENALMEMNRVDCGWRLGVGADISNFYIGLSGDFGLCNMLKDGGSINSSIHENQFQLTLGYNFK